jgi:sugar/nucleoside kinase (ribokinase family)
LYSSGERGNRAMSGGEMRGAVGPIVCLGEALVDLVCEREVESLRHADQFRPHLGGALANVAVAIERGGARASLVSGAGDDPWGDWLRDALRAEGIEMDSFVLASAAPTAVAFVTFRPGGEPEFQVYGEGIAAAMGAAAGHLAGAIERGAALAFGSNTLVEKEQRAVTVRARDRALAEGKPVLFDPNLRPTRWDDLRDAVGLCRSLMDGALLVRTNREESRLLTGEKDPAAAAERIVELGATLGVVSLGADGALVRGAATAEAPGADVEVVSTLGAGDAFFGTLVAGLGRLGWDASRAGEVLPAAIEASAGACTRWGAWA